MLSASRYLLGVAELGLLVGFALLGASRVRSRLLPGWSGPPAWLASIVLALGLSLWVAELLGTFGLFKALPYVLCVTVAGLALWFGLGNASRAGGPGRGAANEDLAHRPSSSGQDPPAWRLRPSPMTLIGLAIAIAAAVHFAMGVRLRLSSGMTGFDSTWYHGPFAAGFFQTGNTLDLHFIAPQFLAWFYPANSELLHAVGMAAFGRDILSPLLNLGWFAGCLLAAWCVGRPFGVAPVSLAAAAVALNVGALSDQAGEARNDILGIFFLSAAVAIALNARQARDDRRVSPGALAVAGLAAGLAAGTKLNFLLPCAALVIGLALAAPKGFRVRALLATGLAALAGGGYWYLRNLIQAGNPLPWVRHLGPISLPAPGQTLGGREGHSVLGYLSDGSVWSSWFLPGLHHGLGFFWPLLGGLAIAGLLLCLGRGSSPVLRVAGVTGLAVVVAWLIAPTSASGPPGVPRGFESGLRYLAPALVLGLALLPVTPSLRDRIGRLTSLGPRWDRRIPTPAVAILGALLALAAVAFGYREQRSYLERRYARPDFATQSLDAAFRWARSVSGARIATTSTRQYPLFGTDLSNRVQYVGIERPHGGFVAPADCRAWRRAIDAGHYDYVVGALDRLEPGEPAYTPAVRWTAGPTARIVFRKPGTAIIRLTGPLDVAGCPG